MKAEPSGAIVIVGGGTAAAHLCAGLAEAGRGPRLAQLCAGARWKARL